jgi:hypothetical protein
MKWDEQVRLALASLLVTLVLGEPRALAQVSRADSSLKESRPGDVAEIVAGVDLGTLVKVETRNGEFLEENVSGLWVRVDDRRDTGFKWGALLGPVVGTVIWGLVFYSSGLVPPESALVVGPVTGVIVGAAIGVFVGSQMNVWAQYYP